MVQMHSLNWFASLLYIAAIVVLVFAQIGIHRIRDEKKAHKPIANVVRGFILLRISEICAINAMWSIPSIIFYLIFELVLKLRPEQSQI